MLRRQCCARRVEQIFQHAFNRTRDARAEQRINNNFGARNFFAQIRKRGIVFGARERNAALHAQFPIHIVLHRHAPPHIQRDLRARVMQNARADQTIAAVVAGTDEDENMFAAHGMAFQNRLRAERARAFHHCRKRIARSIRALFERAHLKSGYEFHS